ncbi:MAG: GTP cyclohydrolase II [Alphaproteobacteria bacterium]
MTYSSTVPRDPEDRQALLRRVEDAGRDLRRGRMVVLYGEKTRFAVLAAECITGDAFAALRRRGDDNTLVAMTSNRAAVLRISPTGNNTVIVSMPDHFNSRLIRSLADPTQDLSNPVRGPFVPETEAPSPVLDAAIRLCKLVHLLPMVVVAEIDGPMDGVLEIRTDDVWAFDETAAISLQRVSSARVPLQGAEDSRLIAFRPMDGGVEHLAIVIGDPSRETPVLARLHSECFTGDLLESLKCDCGQQLRGAIEEISAAGGGVLLYLAQEGRGIGLINKLRAYHLQDEGFDTIEANERLGFDPDERLFLPAAEMLRNLGFTQIRLMTNNPDKVETLSRLGIDVVERVPHEFPSNAHNELYLATKAKRSGHYLSAGKKSAGRKP